MDDAGKFRLKRVLEKVDDGSEEILVEYRPERSEGMVDEVRRGMAFCEFEGSRCGAFVFGGLLNLLRFCDLDRPDSERDDEDDEPGGYSEVGEEGEEA